MRSALGLAGLWPGRRRTSLGCQRQLMAPTAPPSRCALTHLNEKAPTSGAFHEVGGTGLEPVTPSLSTRSGVRFSSPGFAHGAWFGGIPKTANAPANANERRALPLLPH